MTDLYPDHKAEIPEEWYDAFDTLTSQGNSPSGIRATIDYVTTEHTQKESAREFGVSEVTIRNLQEAVVALGPIDRKRESTHSGDDQTSMDYATHVADILGWEVGREYSINNGGYGDSPQPALRKEGWRALREHLREDQQ